MNEVYIELFLLDNILMNLLILRIASVLLAKRARLLRMSLFAVSAAIYAAVAVGIFPVLLKLPLKIGAGFILALFMPFRSFREYIKSYLALLLATLIAGGTVFALALAFGERMQNGIALPTAVTGMLLVSLLPKKLRSLAAARLRNDSVVEIALEFRGACMCCTGIIDTGNGLTEPVSALPVILLPENGSGAELRSRLGRKDTVPVPMLTAGGEGMVRVFIPDRITVNGCEVSACAAFSRVRTAVVPPSAAAGIEHPAALS